MRSHRGSLSIVLLVLGVALFAGGYYPNYVSGNNLLGDTLELMGTAILLVGACMIVARLTGGGLTTRLIYASAACLVLSRFADFTEELRFLDNVPLLGAGGAGNRVMIRGMESVGYIGILLAFLMLLYEVARLRDTADKERARYKKLHEDSFLLARVVDMSSEAVFGCDLSGVIRTWNLGARTLFGYSHEEAVGKPLSDLFVEGLDRLGASPVGWVEVGRPWREVELVGRRQDGRTFAAAASISHVSDDKGGIVGASITVLDVEARKRVERELMASRNLLASALYNAEVGMFILDRDLVLVEFNARMEELIGIPRQGMPPFEEACTLLLDSSIRFAQSVRERVIAKGAPVEFRNLAIHRPDGHTRVCNAAVTPVFDDKGAVVGAACIVVDITEREELQTRLLEAQKMESLGRLAGGIAHDFNNILGGILGYASLLREKTDEGSTYNRYAAAIEDSAARASELTHQLLAFARGRKVELCAVDLNDVAAETLKLLALGMDPNIEVVIDKCPELAAVSADPGQMSQMLMNLLINARDAVGGEGRIGVGTENVEVDELARRRLNLLRTGMYVRIRVEDNGPGMPPEVCQRIFEPFFTTKDKTEGYGLGLSVVYGIIQAHKGCIDVDTEPGRGTRMDVYLPASDEGGVKPAGGLMQRMDTRGTETILVVDDEQLIQTLLRDVLETAGYTVVPAMSGEQAVELYEERGEGIALVIMDLLMPGIGGARALEILRERNPRLKCIISSGYGTETVDSSFLGDKYIRFMPKPYQAQVMARCVRELIDA